MGQIGSKVSWQNLYSSTSAKSECESWWPMYTTINGWVEKQSSWTTRRRHRFSWKINIEKWFTLNKSDKIIPFFWLCGIGILLNATIFLASRNLRIIVETCTRITIRDQCIKSINLYANEAKLEDFHKFDGNKDSETFEWNNYAGILVPLNT